MENRLFAKVIIDINHRDVDRGFTYRVPESFREKLELGTRVFVPFGKGNTLRKGYIIEFLTEAGWEDSKIKEIDSVCEKDNSIDEELISLAIAMRNRYGGTLNQSLSVVLGTPEKINRKKKEVVRRIGTLPELEKEIAAAEKKKYTARLRLLRAFTERDTVPYSLLSERLHITKETIRPYIGTLFMFSEPEENRKKTGELRGVSNVKLTEEQEACIQDILQDERTGQLLFGVTGSGKTEIYLRLISEVVKSGKEVIVLIPEISLTYQTLLRFYDRFPDQVSFVHSKLTKGEKYERFSNAREGKIKIMIGPRSALFTPFQNLGMIVIDEFHDGAYCSENVPRYNSIETAFLRMSGKTGKVVLGSATPSTEYFYYAKEGKLGLHELKNRAVSGSLLPEVSVVDLRKELQKKNRSIFSAELFNAMTEALEKKEQVMLFLNRRGYSGAVSCRECGKPLVCPHCSVPLSLHRNQILKCHYCGYETANVTACPECRSTMIGAFGIGTEKVEKITKELFPSARVLRMDADTVREKDGYEKILEAFAEKKADILIGTQMIVKGHDFPDVTLVGILAADLSMLIPDFRSAEQTFQLLTQAAGRAGRREKKGRCIIQTYQPDSTVIKAVSEQSFETFYESEIQYRKALSYPPFGFLTLVQFSDGDEETLKTFSSEITERMKRLFPKTVLLGPAEDRIYKLKDRYRMTVYVKTKTDREQAAVKYAFEKTFGEMKKPKMLRMIFGR